MRDQTCPSAIRALIDRQAIADVLHRYCRALDRRDFALLRRVYWPDAVDDHAVMRGTVGEFITYSIPFLNDVVTSHMVTNVLIEFATTHEAYCECYFSALHDLPGTGDDAGRVERTVGGRYVDRFEYREEEGGEWRIAARTVVIDWYREGASSSVWDHGRYANLPNRGGVKPDDPLYRLNPLATDGD